MKFSWWSSGRLDICDSAFAAASSLMCSKCAQTDGIVPSQTQGASVPSPPPRRQSTLGPRRRPGAPPSLSRHKTAGPARPARHLQAPAETALLQGEQSPQNVCVSPCQMFIWMESSMYLGKPVNLRFPGAARRLIGPDRFGPSFIDSVIPGPASSPFIAFHFLFVRCSRCSSPNPER